MTALWIVLALVVLLGVVAVYDLTQRKHAILRNFPVVGHLRYILERFGPELRQYIVAADEEERPFTRDQRSWIYASAKQQNNLEGYGTDQEVEHAAGYLVIRHATFPHADEVDRAPDYAVPCAKVVGGPRQRKKAFRPTSIVNTSAMSFGSLSGVAVQSINRGAALAGCLQNTGEGGISPHHLHGGGLIWQIGTGYFGCRTLDGRFDLDQLVDKCARHDVRMLEIKLSQGAKPGKGGILPGAKVSEEIARIRGVIPGQDVISPAGHTAFRSADELLDFVERLADATGLPVGIKSAVGQLDFWTELADLMARTGRGVDTIQIDGGEGGTGAAPPAFADHVALPFKLGFTSVYRIFAERDLQHRVVWIGSGRLGFPEQTLLAMGLGCDLIAVAREAMLSIGCIQALKCHTDHCPTGVATQNPRFTRGLDPDLKYVRFANYIRTLRHEVLALAHACGEAHPALVPLDRFEILGGVYSHRSAPEVFGYQPGWGEIPQADREAIERIMAPDAPAEATAVAK